MLALAAHVYELGLCPKNASSMHGIVMNTRLLITGYSTMRTKKNNASIMAVISPVLLECVLAPEKAR